MDFFKVLKRNLILFWPFSGHGSFMAFLRSAFKVNDFGLLFRSHWLETCVKALENFILAFIHVPVVFHKLRKDVFIGENAPFWDFELIGVAFHGLLELFDPCEDGIDLEGKAPPFGLLVVLFEHVNIFPAEILPVFNRLFDPLGFGDVRPENFQKCGLATADVSLDGETVLVGMGFGIDEILCLHLRVISR